MKFHLPPLEPPDVVVACDRLGRRYFEINRAENPRDYDAVYRAIVAQGVVSRANGGPDWPIGYFAVWGQSDGEEAVNFDDVPQNETAAKAAAWFRSHAFVDVDLRGVMPPGGLSDVG